MSSLREVRPVWTPVRPQPRDLKRGPGVWPRLPALLPEVSRQLSLHARSSGGLLSVRLDLGQVRQDELSDGRLPHLFALRVSRVGKITWYLSFSKTIFQGLSVAAVLACTATLYWDSCLGWEASGPLSQPSCWQWSTRARGSRWCWEWPSWYPSPWGRWPWGWPLTWSETGDFFRSWLTSLYWVGWTSLVAKNYNIRHQVWSCSTGLYRSLRGGSLSKEEWKRQKRL